MEVIDKKVYRLDVGDYYSLIVFGGEVSLFGFSQSFRALRDETLDYARRYKHGDAFVYICRRRSLGCGTKFVAKFKL